MKKHILGLIAFVFIISVSTLGIFLYRDANINNLKTDVQVLRIEGESLSAKQALIYPKTGIFVLDVKSLIENDYLILKFFEIKNEKPTLIATEKIIINQNRGGLKTSSYFQKYEWATNLNSKSNIYLIVERDNYPNDFSTKFDYSRAIPVLLSDVYLEIKNGFPIQD